MYESGNALRGIFLTAFVALLLFSSFIFCFHLERPNAMTVEPEMTGYYFYHPDIAVFHPSENNAALTAKDPTAAGSTTGSTAASSPALPVSVLQNTKAICDFIYPLHFSFYPKIKNERGFFYERI